MSRGDPDPGGGSGAWSGQEGRRSLTSYGASEDHLPSDTSTVTLEEILTPGCVRGVLC